MLLELLVENYAVVERSSVRFHPGLNVLTGETGSGKSIVVDALGLLFGGRASADMLRSGCARGRVSGIFEAGKSASRVLESAGIECEDGEILIEREILSSGKSRAFVASRPAAVSLLRELARYLGAIHGQHEQQQLFSRDAQLDWLDLFGGTEELRRRTGELFAAWRESARRLEELDRNEQERLRSLDVWKFQRDEILAANLKEREDERLEAERKVLLNAGKLIENANVAYAALYDAPESAETQIRAAVRRLEELCRIDASLDGALESAKAAAIALEDAAASVRDYLGRIEADPDRLEEVESRLAAIGKLKRKYGGTAAEIATFGQSLEAQIEGAESSGERRAQLSRERESLASEFETHAADLSAKRRAAASRLGKKVQEELRQLAMESSRFTVEVASAAWSESGVDAVEYFFSANAGEDPKPMEKVASGGELSRIALALKTCVIDRAKTHRTLVFDEVDAGVGGMAAESVGRKLKSIASRSQVLCVTHLAQIAGFADHHFVVSKQEIHGRTAAAIEELSGEARTREIGRMLSGHRLTPEALRHAEQLIRTGESA